MRCGRDDVDGALADVARALELIRHHRDPQMVVSGLGAACRCLLELGRPEEARAVAADLKPHIESAFRATFLVPVAWVAEPVGLLGEVRAALALVPENPWRRAANAVLDGEWQRAADAFAGIEIAPDEEAAARLRAGQVLVEAGDNAGAEREVERALAFYRSVAATRYIRQAEELLATTTR